VGLPPYPEISLLSRHEAHRKSAHRPAYYVHKWWARRTGSVFRGILLDHLLGPGEDRMAAMARSHDFSDTVVLDCFHGGGTTIGEALRLGCKVVGSELNPVAHFLVSQIVRDLEPEALDAAFERVRAAAEPALRDMYATTCPGCDGEAQIQYTSWVKQVDCEACGDPADLQTTRVVMADFTNPGGGLVQCPRCDHPWRARNVKARVQCPGCRHRFVPAKRLEDAKHYRCGCGHRGAILDAVAVAVAGAARPPGHRIACLVTHCDDCGRGFKTPDDADLVRYTDLETRAGRQLSRLAVPRGAIPAGRNTNQMLRYGYRRWHEMFNGRQLVGLDTLVRAVRAVDDPACRDALALHLSSILEFHSMFASSKGLGTGAIRQVFSHHAFIPAKAPLEGHLWGVGSASGGSSGGFASLYGTRLKAALRWKAQPTETTIVDGARARAAIAGERLAARPAERFDQLADGTADVLLLNQSSSALPEVPDCSVDLVVTDPPYADNVMYAELSDYFYVWLRELLPDHPSFQAELVDDAREAVQNRHRGRDGDAYADLLAAVFTEVARVLKDDGRMTFTFHHANQAAWHHLQAALVASGFAVERWWPVFAEMESAMPILGKEHNGHLDIVFVCAKRHQVAGPAAQDTVGEMGRKLAAAQLPMVAADHRALLNAKALQAATFGVRSSTRSQRLLMHDASDAAVVG
jgi:putative DNA methylase